MQYSQIVQVYEKLESTTKKLEKRGILAEFYRKCSEKDLYRAVVLSMGTVFPRGEKELGVAGEMMKRAIVKVTGASEREMSEAFKGTGDLGLTAETLMQKRKQKTLAKKPLTTDLIFENLQKLPDIAGAGSQEKKVSLIAELLSSASGKEAKYVVRTTLGQMRIGVAAGIVRDALAKAFDSSAEEIEHVYNLIGDYGRIAENLKGGKLGAEIEVFVPVRVMLADRGKNLKTAMDTFEKVALEFKFDGFRVQIHKSGSGVRIFSRRMEDVTNQFPDIAAWAKSHVTAKECILDGEALAVDANGRALAFQQLSRRIQRKYDIEKMVKQIPVRVYLFDVIYLDGKSLMARPLRERWETLKKIISGGKNFRLADHIEPKNFSEAKKFYSDAIKAGQEGVIVKNMEAHYQPGRRVGYWLKVKPILEPLDLVIVGAEWGEGKRSKWLSSMILAARSDGKLLETGRMASGFTEAQLEELTKKLRELITEEHGKIVAVRPTVVVEIGYEEIQKSPKYASGYALRFPRLLRIRDDKSPNDADAVKTIEKLYKMQRGRKK